MIWPDNHDTTDWNDKFRCVCCNRPIKGEWPTNWIEITNGGTTVAVPGADIDRVSGDYMGFFPVGSSCAKKFKGYTQSLKKPDE